MPSYLVSIVGRFSFSVTWIVAAVIVMSAAGVFLVPTVKGDLGVARQIASLDGVGATVFTTLGAALVGISMASLATPLYELSRRISMAKAIETIWGRTVQTQEASIGAP